MIHLQPQCTSRVACSSSSSCTSTATSETTAAAAAVEEIEEVEVKAVEAEAEGAQLVGLQQLTRVALKTSRRSCVLAKVLLLLRAAFLARLLQACKVRTTHIEFAHCQLSAAAESLVCCASSFTQLQLLLLLLIDCCCSSVSQSLVCAG